MGGDLEYFQKRLSEEKALLEKSDSEQVRSVHRKLADIYAGRLASLGTAGEAAPMSLQSPTFGVPRLPDLAIDTLEPVHVTIGR